jgi:16S rRNA C1402 (ribose-2'-O) methylase RsmI
MDLRAYYKKMRDVEAAITSEEVIVMSKATADGGVDGVLCEVSRATAARLIVEKRARLATSEEVVSYRKQSDEQARRADQECMARKVQVAVLSDADFRSLKDAQRKSKT